jgi:hypothetical protein
LLGKQTATGSLLKTFKHLYMRVSIFKSTLVKSIALGFIFLSAFSTKSKAGGIVFEIYLNNNLLLKQAYSKVVSGSPDLNLTTANYNDNLRIFFSSCGASSKTRSVGIKNENNEVIKKWDFENSSTSDLSMTIPVKEILDLQKGKTTNALRLFYFSPDQFKEGFMLASVQSSKKELAFEYKSAGQYWPVYTAGIFALGALGWVVRKKA